MKLSNPFRRATPPSSSPALPSASSSSTPSRRHSDAVVPSLSSALSAVTSVSHKLSSTWREYELDTTLLPTIRSLHARLSRAVDHYFSLLRVRDSTAITEQVRVLNSSSAKLAQIDRNARSEIERFEHASLDIQNRASNALGPAQIAAVCEDANDVLAEINQFIQTSPALPRLDPTLQHAKQLLVDVINRNPPPYAGYGGGPIKKDNDKRAYHASNYAQYQPRAVPNPAAAAATAAATAATVSTVHSKSSTRPPPIPYSRKDKFTSLPRNTHTRRKDSSSESGDDGPMKRVKSRTSALREIAASYRSLYSQSNSEQQQQQPLLASTRDNASFATKLYRTRSIRREAITDDGLKLERSAVRGDGRCLFRAIARALYHRKHKRLPTEKVERDDADRLRQKAVNELIKRRALIDQHFVIEGDFEEYTKEMALVKTYGGEPELLMLAKLLHLPIVAYIEEEGEQYRQIQIYGRQYKGNPLRILYSKEIHYDSLLPIALPSS